MATNLALDDSLIEEARIAGKHRTKKDAVTMALREYIQKRRQQEILDFLGTLEFAEKPSDYKKRRLRK